jgi:hypothetical protein
VLLAGLLVVVDNVPALDLVDDLLIVICQRAAAGVTSLNGGVKTSLLDVPFCDFEMLINVHLIPLSFVFVPDRALSSKNIG